MASLPKPAIAGGWLPRPQAQDRRTIRRRKSAGEGSRSTASARTSVGYARLDDRLEKRGRANDSCFGGSENGLPGPDVVEGSSAYAQEGSKFRDCELGPCHAGSLMLLRRLRRSRSKPARIKEFLGQRACGRWSRRRAFRVSALGHLKSSQLEALAGHQRGRTAGTMYVDLIEITKREGKPPPGTTSSSGTLERIPIGLNVRFSDRG